MKDDQEGNDMYDATTSVSLSRTTTTITTELAAALKKRKRNEDKRQEDDGGATAAGNTRSRTDGCSCEGSCLMVSKKGLFACSPCLLQVGARFSSPSTNQHSCSCLVQGRFCDPSSCTCCMLDTSTVTVEPSISLNARSTCQNNDRVENVESRKEALLTAMQDHPELFWKNRKNESDHNNAMVTEDILILESTDDSQDAMDTVALTPHNNSAKARSRDVDATLWTSIQELLNRKWNTCDTDDVDSNNALPSSVSALHGLPRILQELVVCKVDRMEAEDDCCTDGAQTATSKGVASKLVQDTTKDLAQIIQTMVDETARISNDHGGRNHSDSNQNATASNFASDGGKEFPTIDEWVLLCSEDFPEEKGTPKNDDDNTSNDYFANLESRSATFANAGNSNDPFVHNLICDEKGFFEGDDAVVLEEVDITNKNELDTQQQLLLIQETTRVMRVKTLELARQRLKRQNKLC
jgi:hypothetical protein